MRERLWFTGKAEETILGLQDFGARWYDPTVGRFISMDPVGFTESNLQSFNRYAYANNNPYRYVDPDGLWSIAADAFRKDITSSQVMQLHSMRVGAVTAGVTASAVSAGAGAGFGVRVAYAMMMANLGRVTAVANTAAEVVAGDALGGVSLTAAAAVAAKGVWALKDGAKLSTSKALDAAIEHLGPGYEEIASGVFKSADGTRMVRMTNSDLAKTGNHAGAPHMNFETGRTVTKPNGKEQFISQENKHIFLPEDK